MSNSATNREILATKQRELGDRFLRRSLVDAHHILDNLQVDAVSNNPQVIADLHALAHRLAGTAATLGFDDLSTHAFELEAQLEAVTASDTHSAIVGLQGTARQVLAELDRLAHARAIA